MKELVNIEKDICITSIEIAELAEKDHKHVLRDIKKEMLSLGLEKGESIFGLSNYLDKQGKTQPMYVMSKRGAMQLALKYDAITRYKVIKRIEELENETETKIKKTEVVTLPDFTNPAEAARAWAIEYEQKIEAQKAEQIALKENERLASVNNQHKQLILEYTPKISYVDQILSSTGSLTVTQIAKDYGLSATKLNRVLSNSGIQYKSNGQWVLYSKYDKHGYTVSRTHNYTDRDGVERCKVDTRWTQKGRMFIHNFLKNNNIYPQCEVN